MDSKQYDGSRGAMAGARALCSVCGKPIELVGTPQYWEHVDRDITKRHAAQCAFEIDTRVYDGSYVPEQPDFTPDQWDFIKARIDKVLADRVVMAPQYFAVDNDQIVSVAYLNLVAAGLYREIKGLNQQVAQLQISWWKRWFGR